MINYIRRSIVYILLMTLFFSCKSTKTGIDDLSITELENKVSKKLMIFKAESALPLLSTATMQVNSALLTRRGDSPSRIMLSGKDNLKIVGDSAIAKLPFYGEIRVADYNYGKESSITFENAYSDFSITNKKGKRIILKFDVEAHDDSYDVMLEVYPNKSANLTITGTKRTQMRYMGNVTFYESVQAIEED